MNAGAYGGEIKDVLVSTVVVDQHGNLLTLSADELDLEYRSSNIPEKGYIVLEATFALEEGEYDAIKAVMDDLTYKRNRNSHLSIHHAAVCLKGLPGTLPAN